MSSIPYISFMVTSAFTALWPRALGRGGKRSGKSTWLALDRLAQAGRVADDPNRNEGSTLRRIGLLQVDWARSQRRGAQAIRRAASRSTEDCVAALQCRCERRAFRLSFPPAERLQSYIKETYEIPRHRLRKVRRTKIVSLYVIVAPNATRNGS